MDVSTAMEASSVGHHGYRGYGENEPPPLPRGIHEIPFCAHGGSSWPWGFHGSPFMVMEAWTPSKEVYGCGESISKLTNLFQNSSFIRIHLKNKITF